MLRLASGLFLLGIISTLSAQPSITITATRSIALPPDEAVFSVLVNSGLNSGLDDVVTALQGSGVTAANLLSVSALSPQPGGPALQWAFRLSVPFSKLENTITSLTALQKAIKSFTLAFGIQAAQVSPHLQASQQCPIADLIADARTQAQKIATGTGASIGPILALSDGGFDRQVAVPTATTRIGDFRGDLPGVIFTGIFLPTPVTITPPLACTITVKFALLTSQ